MWVMKASDLLVRLALGAARVVALTKKALGDASRLYAACSPTTIVLHTGLQHMGQLVCLSEWYTWHKTIPQMHSTSQQEQQQQLLAVNS